MTKELKTTAMAVRANSGMIQPESFSEVMEFSTMIAKSSICPPNFKGKPEEVLIAIQMGSEIGLSPMQAVQSIAVIQGRPCVWGDAMMALALAHPMCEDVKEWFTKDEKNGITAHCMIKRRGCEPHEVKFSQADAKQARLWGKSGPWTSYPKRMLQMRARGFAIRDRLADALKGIAMAEEARDIPPKAKPEEEVNIVDVNYTYEENNQEDQDGKTPRVKIGQEGWGFTPEDDQE